MNKTRWMLAAALAAAALGAQADGDAPDVERPSMRTPVPAGPGLTREEVRDSLDRARDTGRMGDGEIADTPAVLQAREDFAAAQAEVLRRSDGRP